MILGITGGTGCGKTTLLSILREYGAQVLDCDKLYHDLLLSDTRMLDGIRARFPGAFPDGYFDRKALGRIVFADPVALDALNAITHAAVRREVERQLAQRPELAAIDAIGLFESGLNRLCDLTIAVTASEDSRVKRLMQRDGISREYALSRIRAQHSSEWFLQRCNAGLENNGSPEEFYRKCIDFLHTNGIISLAKPYRPLADMNQTDKEK